MEQIIECCDLGLIVDVPVELTKLKSQNKTLRNLLIGLTIGGVALVCYNIYQNNKKNE